MSAACKRIPFRDLAVDNTTLLAALTPGAYSTASLTVGGTFEVQSGGAAYFSGMLGAAAVVNSGGTIRGNGTLTATDGSPIVNDGTIEVTADHTLGLQRLNVTNDISSTSHGTLLIDAGATLRLGGAVSSNQTIQFAANSIAQFANDPYSPSTIVLAQPDHALGATITDFTFADRLVLEDVEASHVSYDGVSDTLTVDKVGGGSLAIKLSGTPSGSLTGLIPSFTPGSPTTIMFAPWAAHNRCRAPQLKIAGAHPGATCRQTPLVSPPSIRRSRSRSRQPRPITLRRRRQQRHRRR